MIKETEYKNVVILTGNNFFHIIKRGVEIIKSAKLYLYPSDRDLALFVMDNF